MQARYIVLTVRMSGTVVNLGEPHTQAMGAGMFEVRLKSAEGIARVMYGTLVGRRIVIVRHFFMKTPKTNPADPARWLHCRASSAGVAQSCAEWERLSAVLDCKWAFSLRMVKRLHIPCLSLLSQAT